MGFTWAGDPNWPILLCAAKQLKNAAVAPKKKKNSKELNYKLQQFGSKGVNSPKWLLETQNKGNKVFVLFF